MLKRGSGTRRLQVFSNLNSRAARAELLKQTPNNNNKINNNSVSAINVSENNYSPNVVSASPSPAGAEVQHAVRASSPALEGRSVRHLSGAKRQTYNVRNTAQPQHASVFGKQVLQALKMRRSRNSRSSRSSRRRRQTRRRRN